MDKIRCVMWGVMLLMAVSYWGPADSAAKDLTSKAEVSEKTSTSPERLPTQGIACNWSGWRNSFPEVKCRYNRCSGYREILMMKCSEGFITEVKAKRVCAACDEI